MVGYLSVMIKLRQNSEAGVLQLLNVVGYTMREHRVPPWPHVVVAETTIVGCAAVKSIARRKAKTLRFFFNQFPASDHGASFNC